MPFTPVHMGPGMAVKAAMPRHFSIVVFGMTQVALDLEVLWYLVQRDFRLHQFWHTYLGATFVGIGCALIGKPLSQAIKFLWNTIAKQGQHEDLCVRVPTTWAASILGAMIGVYSHVLLDSMFHADVEPFQPWSSQNPFYGLAGPGLIQMICIVLGLGGLIGYRARARRTQLPQNLP